ncbi:MAG: cytochrome c [Nitrospira sp.]|nr:cytochrome c [Candidatus Manganitrophaceae bacterium]HIL35487.1 cytochrome c [Candidatus Manganitrophaceae bacterium]
MEKWLVLAGVFTALSLTSCSSDSSRSPSTMQVRKAPAEFAKGETFFNESCAGCHGKGAIGTDRGPTFLSKIYAPNHHGDAAFLLAPQRGVRAHHWKFGNMPKISGLETEEIKAIIPYIRWLQKEAGIF